MAQHWQFNLLALLLTVALLSAAIALGCFGFADGNENVMFMAAAVVVFWAACGNLVGHPVIGALIGLVCLAEGVACGWCVGQFGELGALSLAGFGALSGYLWSRMARSASKLAGGSLAIATAFAFFIAETCWLHWNTRNGEPSWRAAIGVGPLFLREYTLSALIGMASAAYGAWSAYGYASVPGSQASTPEVSTPPLPDQ